MKALKHLLLCLVLTMLAGSWAYPARIATSCEALLAQLEPSQREQMEELGNALTLLPPAKAARLRETLEAFYFIDYVHAVPELLKFFDNQLAIEGLKLESRYDIAPIKFLGIVLRRGKSAYESYESARDYLKNSRSGLSVPAILEVHRRVMNGGVEEISPDALGKIRTIAVYGNAETWRPLAPAELEAVRSNPYLVFERTGGGDFRIEGKIWYPEPATLPAGALARVRELDSALYFEVQEFQRSAVGRSPAGAKNLMERLVRVLLEERVRWFNRERAVLGLLDMPSKIERYVRLVAEFQRDFIAIHPFVNGNGRTSRLIMNALLEKEGLPPARLLDTAADIQMSLEAWTEEVIQGVLATRALQEDLIGRIQSGLPIENSVDLFIPILPRAMFVDLRRSDSERVTEGHRLARLDSRQFGAWFKIQREIDASWIPQLRNAPIETLRELYKQYAAYILDKKVDLEHPKRGRLELELSLVDEDFIEQFGQAIAPHDEDQWQSKMSIWYTDQLIYRGLSRREGVYSDREILERFLEVSPHMASNRIGGLTGEALVRAAKQDFYRYNREVIAGQFTQLAIDHSQSGPQYGQSYGYSTSLLQQVAEGFAMGAMVVAPYGPHRDPQYQRLLSDRIVMGVYRAKKDVELNSLRHLLPEFRSKFARQQEVMGIGAADPDSVMVVQRIDAEAKVIRSWVRSPDDPDLIWILRGEYIPAKGESPPAELIERSVRLSSIR